MKTRVELLQVDMRIQSSEVEGDEVRLMQSQATAIDIGDSPTEEMPENPVAPSNGHLKGDEALFFERIQVELLRLKKHKAVGAIITQLHFHLRQLQLSNVWDRDRLASVEALVISYNNEATDEGMCTEQGDLWVAKWMRRIVAFVGGDVRERHEQPWQPSRDELQHRHDSMMEEIRLEIKEEKIASEAQAADDLAIRQALQETQHGGTAVDRLLTGSEFSSPSPKRVRVERNQAASPTAEVASVVSTGSSVEVRLRVQMREPVPVSDKGVQTGED